MKYMYMYIYTLYVNVQLHIMGQKFLATYMCKNEASGLYIVCMYTFFIDAHEKCSIYTVLQYIHAYTSNE